MTEPESQVVTIVGGGASAHVLIPFLSGAGFEVNLLTRRPEEWSSEVDLQLQSIHGEVQQIFHGTLAKISADPAEVVPDADVVVLCMPVCKYRIALHQLGPHLATGKEVFVGTIYGQAGFNWMVREIAEKLGRDNLTTFAVGLIPWICRIVDYGKVGVTYGCKAVNVAAVSPAGRFEELNRAFLPAVCERWLGKGAFRQSGSFLSLTLSVDNQIIHPSRCYGLFLEHGGRWHSEEEIPYFYRDFDQRSADLLQELDADYSTIREALKARYPDEDFELMLDYLALERLSYQSENTDIRESFRTSPTLGAIKPPTKRLASGEWAIDTDHRFFTDDIFYGLAIAKWIADRLELAVPTIDRIIDWAQRLRAEKIIEGDRLLLDSECLTAEFASGIPPMYGIETLDGILG
ncbi:MAG: hypothetical protein GY719_42640 [bacterium]|nr:hypothetical protein [bacterium]